MKFGPLINSKMLDIVNIKGYTNALKIIGVSGLKILIDFCQGKTLFVFQYPFVKVTKKV